MINNPATPPGFIRAMTIYEPYATAIAEGLKRYETRTRPTYVRGDILICAGKRPPCGPLNVIDSATLKPGHALAIVELYGCQPVEEISPGPQERLLGNFSAGRFAWCLRNVRRLETPVPVKGSQGFFYVPVRMLRGQYTPQK
jgi:hypothetical protein